MAMKKSNNRKKYHKEYYNYQKLLKFLKKGTDANDKDIKSDNKRV